MNCRVRYIIVIILVLGCHEDDPPSGEMFLNQMLNIMENNSIHKHTIDWSDFRGKVFARVPGARTIKDAEPGILLALKMLGDNHSFIVKPDGSTFRYDTLSLRCNSEVFLKPAMPANVGYVKVNGTDYITNLAVVDSFSAEAVAFSKEIQEQIKSHDNANIVGWIVDLRNNWGGNMWPMLAGIGPVLGEGIAGYSIDADSVATWWGYKDGAAVSSERGGIVRTNVTDPYELIVSNPKVAVLLDKGVASSGEAMAISFIGRANTRSFGSPTCGLSTSNRQFVLLGGYTLGLTTAYQADRNKSKYGIPIVPDQISSNESIIQDAINWIQN